MPTSKNLQPLNVGLPPQLVEEFFSAMPAAYKKTTLVAAALDAFRSYDPDEIHKAIAGTVERYGMASSADARSSAAKIASGHIRRARQGSQDKSHGRQRAS